MIYFDVFRLSESVGRIKVFDSFDHSSLFIIDNRCISLSILIRLLKRSQCLLKGGISYI